MTDSDDRSLHSVEDVSAAYRELAQERAPTDLDRSVLKLARQNASGGGHRNWLTARIRPLAFVVTAGLSLALLVQLGNTPSFQLPGSGPTIDEETVGLPDNAFQDAASGTAEQIRQLESEAAMNNQPDDAAADAVGREAAPPGPSVIQPGERCTDGDRRNSGTWWQCIRELEKRGHTEAAERELRALLQTHPQFSAPQ